MTAHDTRTEKVGPTRWRWVCSCGRYGPQVSSKRRALDGAWQHMKATIWKEPTR